MSIWTDPKYRIKRSAAQEKQMQYLTQDLKIFQSYSQVVMASAIVGYINKECSFITDPASDGILMQFFTQRDYDVMDFLAYAFKKEQAVLKTTEKYEIFSAYANGGFPILVKKLGINFDEPEKNDRLAILRKYYSLLLEKDAFIAKV